MTLELEAVRLISEAAFIGNCEQLLSALLAPSCGVEEVLPENISRYLMLLRKAQVRPHGCTVTSTIPEVM